jgi:hypothetical protein
MMRVWLSIAARRCRRSCVTLYTPPSCDGGGGGGGGLFRLVVTMVYCASGRAVVVYTVGDYGEPAGVYSRWRMCVW